MCICINNYTSLYNPPNPDPKLEFSIYKPLWILILKFESLYFFCLSQYSMLLPLLNNINGFDEISNYSNLTSLASWLGSLYVCTHTHTHT